MKKTMYSEISYLLGLVALGMGTAWIEKADFGVSMVVAPAYLIFLRVSEVVPWFTFGMAEYAFQFLLLVLLSVVMRKIKISYLWCFLTVVLYGLCLDGAMWLTGLVPEVSLLGRCVFYSGGILLATLGIAFLLHTYILPEAYELFVKEIAGKYKKPFSGLKVAYDMSSLVLSVLLSFLFFGRLEGIHIGTVICAVVNGFLIGMFSKLLEKQFVFKDAFPLKKYFGN